MKINYHTTLPELILLIAAIAIFSAVSGMVIEHSRHHKPDSKPLTTHTIILNFTNDIFAPDDAINGTAK